MRNMCPAAVAALTILTSSAMFGQGPVRNLSADAAQSLSITNYQFVSEQRITRTSSYVTYRADLVNQGPAQSAITATVTSLAPSVQTVPGQDTLKFGPVPSNAQDRHRWRRCRETRNLRCECRWYCSPGRPKTN